MAQLTQIEQVLSDVYKKHHWAYRIRAYISEIPDYGKVYGGHFFVGLLDEYPKAEFQPMMLTSDEDILLLSDVGYDDYEDACKYLEVFLSLDPLGRWQALRSCHYPHYSGYENDICFLGQEGD